MTPSRRAALAPILAVVLVGVSWFWAVRAAGADEVVPVTGNRYCTETNVGGTTVRGLVEQGGRGHTDQFAPFRLLGDTLPAGTVAELEVVGVSEGRLEVVPVERPGAGACAA